MFISDQICFVELGKTGCSYIRKVLDQNIKLGKLTKIHDQISNDLLNSKKLKIGSIRNPLDWYISLLCNQNLLNVYINTDNTIAKQILHLSDLNNHKECFLCDKSPNSEKIIPYSTKETTLIAIITIFVIIYLIK